MSEKCTCGHEQKLHTTAEKHVLNTTHCTASGCSCKQFEPKVKL